MTHPARRRPDAKEARYGGRYRGNGRCRVQRTGERSAHATGGEWASGHGDRRDAANHPGALEGADQPGADVHLAGLEPEPGDAVLFHTGWGAHWDDPERYLSAEPGPGLEVADWLAERGVALTGCDTWSYGPVPPEDPTRPFEVPKILNVEHGVFIVENLDTAELAAAGVREFCLVLTHPKLRGATGAWTSPIALV
jgi:kynurenine formamidase